MSATNLRKWIKKTFEDVDVTKRKVSIVIHREVVKRTPVDRGWARMHWRIENAMTGGDPGGGDPSVGKEYYDEPKIGTVNGKLDIYIYNRVAYIIPLDRATSGQAGKGQMVAHGIAAARNFMES